MKPVQVFMEEELVKELDKEAKRRRSDRSKLVRAAVRRFLAVERRREREEQDRRAYERFPDDPKEAALWASIAAWPEED